MIDHHLDRLIDSSLYEDMPFSDITTESLICESVLAEAVLTSKDTGVIAGLPVAVRVFQRVDPTLTFQCLVEDGQTVYKGDVIMRVHGSAASLLKAERVALNLLQRLSGVATSARKFVEAVEGTNAKIVDTRKTTPLLRKLEKYAVKAGGASNHRFSLSDAVMIKDNHIAAAGSISRAVEMTRCAIPHTMKIEVEVTNLAQLDEALIAGADIIMLDNMDVEMMRSAVEVTAKRAILEASGGVNLSTVRAIAETGVDIISVGALTHSVMALDISMALSLK